MLTSESTDADKSVHQYTLYVKETDIDSMRAMVFILEARLIDFCSVVKDITPELGADIKVHCGQRVRELEAAGKDCLPSLWVKTSSMYVVGDDAIQEYLAKAHHVDLSKLPILGIFDNNTMKDFALMRKEITRLASCQGQSCLRGGLAWFQAMDFNHDGHVTLEEMIQGLDVTRFLAEARRGETIDLDGSRWKIAVEQVDFLNKESPTFVNGWRLRMILGTICDSYDMVIESADKVIELAPGDPHALTLKALYCRALGKQEYKVIMQDLATSCTTAATAIENLVQGVDKYWENPLCTSVPHDLQGQMSILALGSPANDDGTPRPRLLATLERTLEAAKLYSSAHVFVTGAAVSSNMPEAVAMKRWLCDRGVQQKRITMEMKAMDTVGNYVELVPMLRRRKVQKVMLITAHYHLNRSSALADAVFESCNLDVQVVGVAGTSDLQGDDLVKRLAVERPASYRDVARARALFEAEHFEVLCDESNSSNNNRAIGRKKSESPQEQFAPSDVPLAKKLRGAQSD